MNSTKNWIGILLKNLILALAISSLGTIGAGFSITRYEHSLLGIEQASYASIFITQFIFIFVILYIISGIAYVVNTKSVESKIIIVISCFLLITAVLLYATFR